MNKSWLRQFILVCLVFSLAVVIGCGAGYRTTVRNGHETVYYVDENGQKRLVYEISKDGEVTSQDRMVHGDLTIDLNRHEVLRDEKALRLKPKEYDLLVFLARNKGVALSRNLILERVWGWDFDGGTRTVDVHVRWLRSKIEHDPAHPTRIITVRGVGYRFEG